MSLIAAGEPFTTASLTELAISERHLRAEVEAGNVRRLFKNAYVDASVEDSVALRARALRLVVGPDQVVVDRTAAWLHGVDTYAAAEKLGVPAVEVCALRGGNRVRRDQVRGRTRDLTSDDVMLLDGLTVTTPLRTALDLGCHLRRREAFAAMCGLARAYDLEPAHLVRATRTFARRRGVVQLRSLAPLVERRVESQREAWTLLAILDAGLPAPEPQHWIEIDGVPTYRLDFAYVALRVYVEYDGRDFHERTEAQRRHDRERREWLRQNGWTPIIVRSGDFSGAALDRWLGQLRRCLDDAYSTRRW